uniref:Uncharacterized protein n=1 Tax=Arundo donax TaxID=35708 RepID=A0A0A9AXU0_ARUDO
MIGVRCRVGFANKFVRSLICWQISSDETTVAKAVADELIDAVIWFNL